ncbi:sorting nexin-4 [Pontoporia blainvillei]|uniref:Sorting nexin-4 n=1 Tax=Pontoporia blainvillei TaxID=48723 RepID=A0ABX0S769_PONBL|nr:sorting nexin-4 [Pontoporia blainvillei]
MEHTPPDPERLLQPKPLELGHPDTGLESVASEEAEGPWDEGPGDGTTTENNFRLKKMEINVSEAEKQTGRNAMNTQETYTAYLIETRVKNPDKRCTELKHYSDELQSVIAYLLRVRARVAGRLYGVYKVYGNYGDVYASSTDDTLEDEEHYADQLKEYLFYAEAMHKMQAVCRKHELMQYDLEMAAQDLASKKQQCEELATGTLRTFSLKGMTTKLFGQETPEQRDARIKVLEEQINEGEQQLNSKNLEGREFVRNAWADIERFKEQKNRDLKEALISYAVVQISICKKGIQVWTHAKECFSKM